ncbi:hypothetical protein V6T01_07835 [Streptococcus salivarius]|jgi:hypothetical protein|uniref:hypothetical protein n=1 Tax=Streptococcus salivarius TaxID=1304 RepID=UPI00397C5EDA
MDKECYLLLLFGLFLGAILGLLINLGLRSCKEALGVLWKTSLLFFLLDILYSVLTEHYHNNLKTSNYLVGLFGHEIFPNEWFWLILMISFLFFLHQIYSIDSKMDREEKNEEKNEEFFEDLKREIKKEKVSPTTKVNFSKHIEVSDTESVDNSNGLNKSSGKINQRTKVKIEVKIKESNRL